MEFWSQFSGAVVGAVCVWSLVFFLEGMYRAFGEWRKRRRKCEICGQRSICRWTTLHVRDGEVAEQMHIDLCAACLREQQEHFVNSED